MPAETALKGSAFAKARSDLAVAHRRRDPQAIEEAKSRFYEEKIAAWLQQQLAAAPPLTEEQRVRLAELLLPAMNGGI
jgi:hypothetical protein